MSATGVIEGGWEFVTAAYAISSFILVAYVVSVVARFRAESSRRDRDSRPEVNS